MKNAIILFLAVVFFSCQSKQEEEVLELKADVDESSEAVNKNDESDHPEDTAGLAQFRKKLGEGFMDSGENEYIYFSELKHDYGILITDHIYDEIEETYFELFYKKDKKIFRTSNFEKLKEKLTALPPGTVLDWYDTCTFSKMMSLSDEKRQALEEMCKILKIELVPPSWGEETKNIVCYCRKMN